jgi:hypothetical protein
MIKVGLYNQYYDTPKNFTNSYLIYGLADYQLCCRTG